MKITKEDLRRIVLEEINNVLREESLSNEDIENIVDLFNSKNEEVALNLLEPLLEDEEPQFVYSVINQIAKGIKKDRYRRQIYNFLSLLKDSEIKVNQVDLINSTDFIEDHLDSPLGPQDLFLLSYLKFQVGANVDKYIQKPSIDMDRVLDIIPELESIPNQLEWSEEMEAALLFKRFSQGSDFLYAQYSPELGYLYISIDSESLNLTASTSYEDDRWEVEIEDPNSGSVVYRRSGVSDKGMYRVIHGKFFGDFIDRNFDSEEEESEY